MRHHRTLQRPARGAVILLCFAVACGDSRSNVQNFTVSDEQMNAAIDSSRRSVSVLLGRLAAPLPGQTLLVVKKRFGDDAQGEHIWLDSVRLEGGLLHGRITDDAASFPDVRAGQWTTVQPDSVSDWLIIVDGTLCGGFTMRVQRRRLPAAERAQLDQGLATMGLPEWRVTNAC